MKPKNSIIKNEFRIIPKLVLLATLMPVLPTSAQVRSESKKLIELLNDKPHSISEETNVNLACLISCGSSCRFTDNC